MTTTTEVESRPRPVNNKKLRIAEFASFFKRYMSVATLVTASIPIPVASLKLIPMYATQRGYLTVYTSLFCFLLLSFLFSIRHKLSIWMFVKPKSKAVLYALPFVLILFAITCIFSYHALLADSVQDIQRLGVRAPTSEILRKMQYTEIPHQLALAASYLGIFAFAEAAFVLMALREYLQDALDLDEIDMLQGGSGFRLIAANNPLIE